jgi:hypothetical protein
VHEISRISSSSEPDSSPMANICSMVGGSTPMLRADAVIELPRARSWHICSSRSWNQRLPSVRAVTVRARR